MIIQLNDKWKEQTIKLWMEVFGDDYKFISTLFRHFPICNIGWGYITNNSLTSMAFALPLQKDARQGHYLYACGTQKDYRGMGQQSLLIKTIIQKTTLTDDSFIVTLPAEESLFEYYARFGFRRIKIGYGLTTLPDKEIIYPISPECYIDAYMKTKCLETPSYAQWAINSLLSEGLIPHSATYSNHHSYTLCDKEGSSHFSFTLDKTPLIKKDFMVLEHHTTQWDDTLFLFPQDGKD